LVGGLMGKNKEFWETKKLNNRTYLDFYERLMELSINMFEWVNLPDTMDERYLELALFARGKAVIFKDPVMGYLSLNVMYGGRLNIYEEPIERTAYSVGREYNYPLTEDNSVIVYNNRLRTPSMLTIENYAMRLYEIQRAIDTNVKQQKTPFFVKGSEEQMLSLRNVYSQYSGNMPVIMVDESFKADEMMVFQTPAPYVADSLQTLLKMTWADVYTYLGIENNVSDKKERLVSGEVDSSLAVVEANRLTKLNARKAACEKFNRMFGTDIDVQFRQIAIYDSVTDFPSLIGDDYVE
jgi:hypothetical protein